MPDIKIIPTKTEDINPVPQNAHHQISRQVLHFESPCFGKSGFAARLLRSVGFKESETLVLCRSRDSENLILARAVPKR